MPAEPQVLPVPAAFTWRGSRYEIARLLERWTDAGFGDSGRGQHRWWERRHRNCFRVQTTDGQFWDLYLERGSGRRNWFLRRRWEVGETPL